MRTYQLQDFANPISVAVTNPSQSGYSRFVGLEHYDSGEFVVKRYSGTELLTTTAKAFETNDILIARRNVYLKRAGIVFFDGITSGDTIVLRIKNDCESTTGVPKDLAQRIIPIVLNSEHFWIYANKHADGMNSKRISKEMLLTYEFELPSLEEQRVLADKLWAAYEVKESYKNLLAQTDKLLHAQFEKMFGDPRKNDKQWDIKKMGEVFTIERGGSPRPITEYLTDAPEGLNWIKIGDAGEGEKYITSTKEKIKPEGLKKTRLVHKGDFLLSNSMSFGRPYILDIDGCIHDGWLVLHDNYQTFDKSYLYYFLSTPELYEQFKTLAAGGVVNNLNSDIVKKVEIIIPPLEMQLEFVRIAEQAEQTKASLNKGIEAIEAVIRSLIAEGTTKV